MAYQSLRAEIKVRARAFSTKQLHLARHASPLPRRPEGWAESLRRWNERFGGSLHWRYEDLRLYKMDVKAVRRRLLSRVLPFPDERSCSERAHQESMTKTGFRGTKRDD